MAKIHTIQLDELDLCQLLDGVESRAESWEKTANYLRAEALPEGDFFLFEECSDPEEAEVVAEHFRSIVMTIRKQIENQP